MLSALGLLEKLLLIRCSKHSWHVNFDEPSAEPVSQLLGFRVMVLRGAIPIFSPSLPTKSPIPSPFHLRQEE